MQFISIKQNFIWPGAVGLLFFLWFKKMRGLALIIATGLVGFWTGGMMKMDVPPPPSFKPISNVVLFPGAPIPPKVSGPNEDAGTLGGALVKAMKSHAGTISGLCTSLTVVGTSSPPLPYPWVGVK